MKFGIFGDARQKRGRPDTDSSIGYRDWIENNIAAEALKTIAPSRRSIISQGLARFRYR